MRIFALIVFVIFIPVFIFIWGLVFITSKTRSQVVFKQTRLGQHKREFTIYKFRTMDGDKITVMGKYLRKTGFDEMPQLINIIRNDMSFVGPRPLTQFDVDRLMWNAPECAGRWNVKPGITGLAQLSDICDAGLSLQKDLYYVKNKNAVLDIKILLQSLLIRIVGKRKIQS